jgi:hypothetical protein
MNVMTHHGLLGLGEGVASSSQSDNRLRKDDTGGSNSAQDGVNGNRLEGVSWVCDVGSGRTGLSCRGVPSMGTRVLMGNDSGCSGSLESN